MPDQDILCLANSKKRGGRCVAGLALGGGGWLRAVSASQDGTLYPAHYLFEDGSEPGPLDLVRLGLTCAKPACHHPENWLIDGNRWRRAPFLDDAAQVGLLQAHIEPGPKLLRGQGDRVPFDSYLDKPAEKSLTLIAPASLELFRKPNLKGRYLARGRFTLQPGGVSYDLGLTDPVWEPRVTSQARTITLLQDKCPFLLTISLSEPFEGACFKLIATILLLPPGLAGLMSVDLFRPPLASS